MTDHSITPPPELIEQWIQIWVSVHGKDNSLGLDYVAAQAARWGYGQGLEVAHPKINSGPESPLVERVADAIAAQATSAGIVNDRPARAAIREVSLWLAQQSNSVTGRAWAEQLKIEAES